jgi:hypothetical protein
MPQLLADYLILGYRRAGGPGHLYPAIQAVRALATAVCVADSPYESSSEDLSRQNWNSGWIGLAGTPLESGAS